MLTDAHCNNLQRCLIIFQKEIIGFSKMLVKEIKRCCLKDESVKKNMTARIVISMSLSFVNSRF